MPYKDPEKRKAFQQAYRESHRDENRAYQRDYREKNHDAVLAYDRLRYARDRATRGARTKAYYERNREQLQQRNRDRYRANPQPQRKRSKDWRERHPEKMRSYRIAWKRRHPESVVAQDKTRKARLRGAGQADLTLQQWREIKKAYGNRCVYCGERPRKLTQDHVIPVSRGGAHSAANIVPACAKCNAKKGAGPALPFVIERIEVSGRD